MNATAWNEITQSCNSNETILLRALVLFMYHNLQLKNVCKVHISLEWYMKVHVPLPIINAKQSIEFGILITLALRFNVHVRFTP